MIYLLEDDENIRELVCYSLNVTGNEAEGFAAPSEFWRAVSENLPELVILDVMLPEEDGLQVLSKLRSKDTTSDIPVIMLTAKGSEFDKVTALDAGADDYITKPFGAAELLARIRVAIRHTRSGLANESLASSGKFVAGGLTIDYDKHQVLMHGENAKLTVNEYKIVALLGKYAGKVLTYDFIIRELWGPKAKTDNQILRVNMANIRRKVEKDPSHPEYLFTEVGVGYRMREGD